jgi:peptidyl-prolyl cis-trans isomerase SurA
LAALSATRQSLSSTKAFKVIVNVKIKLSNCLRPVLLGAVFLGTSAHAEVQQINRVVAIVDTDVVMQSQLDQRVREVQQTIAKRGDALPPQHVLDQQVLERLIIENIQLQMGDRSGIRITDEELNQAVGTIAQRNNMTLEQFRSALQADGLSYEDAREQIRREMVISRVRQRRVAERIQVSDQEVENFLSSESGKLQLSVEYHLANIQVRVPDGSTSSVIQAAQQRAKELYQQLQQGADFAQLAIASSASDTALEGGDMGWRKAAQLPAPFDAMIGAMTVGEVSEPIRTPGGFVLVKLVEKRGGNNQVRDEVHVRHILIKPSEIRSEQETKRLAERIYDRVISGEDFSELAKDFSEDPGSALTGGDLNWIDPSALVPEFRAVMAKTESGAISKPFQTNFGWHVLQVMGRRATDGSEQFRKQQAIGVLRNRKYEEELQAWLRQIRDEAYVESKL